MEKRPKYGGRKSGTPNKATSELRERVSELLEGRFDAVAADLDQMEPKDRVAAYIKLMEFVLPKQRESKIEMPEDEGPVIIRMNIV